MRSRGQKSDFRREFFGRIFKNLRTNAKIMQKGVALGRSAVTGNSFPLTLKIAKKIYYAIFKVINSYNELKVIIKVILMI